MTTIDSSYKLPFFLALLLHITIAILMIVKFAVPTFYSFNNANVIEAEAVSDQVGHNFNQFSPPATTPAVISSQPSLENTKNFLPPPATVQISKPVSPPVNDLAESLQKEVAVEKSMSIKRQEQTSLEKAVKQETQRVSREDLENDLTKELSNETAGLKVNGAKNSNANVMQDSVGLIDKFKSKILATVSSNWTVPENVGANLEAVLIIDVAPHGIVTNVRIIKSSGNDTLDRSAVNAVLKSSPLPVPDDLALFDNFRNIRLTVRPNGLSG